jgi:hypothetical protein
MTRPTDNPRTTREAVDELNAGDPLAYADAYYASFADLLDSMADEPNTWRDGELSAVLREASRQIVEATRLERFRA